VADPTNPFAKYATPPVEAKVEPNPFAQYLTPAKNYDLKDVPGAALDSAVKTVTEDVPAALSTAAETVLTDPGKAVRATADGVGDTIKSLLSLSSLGITKPVEWGLSAVAPETGKAFGDAVTKPGMDIIEDYKKKYGGWENIKRTMAENPFSFAGDVASVVPLVPKGIGAAKAAITTPRIIPAADAAAAAQRLTAAGFKNVDNLTPTQLDRVREYGNKHGWDKDVVGHEYRRALFDEFDVPPTESMVTKSNAHLLEEDRMRAGSRGPEAMTIINDADQARLGSLDGATNKIRTDLTGNPTPMPPAAIGETISERFGVAHDAAKKNVREAYDRAFNPDELQQAGVPSHVPETTLRGLTHEITNKLVGGDRPFVATKETAPNTMKAVEALNDYARTGRLPSAIPGEPLPPGGAAGVSWQSADLMRRYINGLRESSKMNPTDLMGTRRVIDAFDEQFGKANPLLNDARRMHKERVELFDPNRNRAGAGVSNVLKAAGNTENTGYTLYNKLFGGSHMKKGEAAKTVDHLKQIFTNDPEGLAAVKEGAIQRLFHDPNTYEKLSPQKSASRLKEALNGPAADTYSALFTPEELARLRRYHAVAQDVADHTKKLNPPNTAHTETMMKREGEFRDRGIKKLQAMLDTAGSVAGGVLGATLGGGFGHGAVGAAGGVGAGGIGAHYVTPMLANRFGPRTGARMMAAEDSAFGDAARGAINPGRTPIPEARGMTPWIGAPAAQATTHQPSEPFRRGGYLRQAKRG
jgi:hypothetical protein